ncbi:MAG: transcriptional regulator [Ilumatobacteraceae bacterium]|nr:transcriptional regulator [Ilumatobacteraceae bacterium]
MDSNLLGVASAVVELQQMRYALAVVDAGSFTAAAAACHVAQPSLSQSIRNLERELGVELFHRIGRNIVLTPAGSAFADAARLALRAVDNVRVEVDAVRGLLAGSLDLVALPTLASDPVTPLVGAFRVAHPHVTVRLAHPDGTADLVRSVLRGASELGITVAGAPETNDDDHLTVHPLGRQEIVAVLPPGSKARATLPASALAALPLVTNPVGTSTRALLDSVLEAAGLVADIAVETDQREAIIPLVVAGAGAALLPRSMAATATVQGAVVVPLQPRLWRALVLIHRVGPLSPAGRAFVDIAIASGRRSA